MINWINKRMKTGKVKWFNTEKGFGFIEQDEGGDLFVHISEVKGEELKEGDKVQYEVGQGKKGPCATEVAVVE